MCGVVRDLWRCLVPLLQMHDEDIWEDSLLESVGDEPVAFQTPGEEALLLGEDPEPQGAQASTSLIPIWSEEALKPDDDDSIATDHHHSQQQTALSPMGFKPPTLISSLSPLEDAEPFVRVPREAQLDVISMVSTEVIVITNYLMGEFECCYQMQLISIWSLGPAWCWLRTNGLVSQVSACSKNHCRTIKQVGYSLLKLIKTSIKCWLRLQKPDLTVGCTLTLYFERELYLNSSGDELRTTRLWIECVVCSEL